ncbi:hypothetical protein HK105_207057 [Polyrhizophydium stewartii]|uniref:C2 domain-containing protein n=1 Tax=Polyrhizophydium stewartii TaxID=2732419 RepID=A0ABR4N1Q8_9FUNG
MARSGQYTVQVTVLEGRNFQRKPSSKLYIQCRFNSEILTTDPADHTPTPIWDTELAWDVESKVLSFLRSQRASLKLVCYAIDSATNKRDSLGYVMLDLRAATQGPPPFPERWFGLVHSKTQQQPAAPPPAFRPEIRLSFTVQPRQEAGAAAGAMSAELAADAALGGAGGAANRARPGTRPSARRDGGRLAPSGSASGLGATAAPGAVAGMSNVSAQRTRTALANYTSVPIELKSDGFYQVGDGAMFFNFWITIAFAEHLSVLLDDADPAPQPTANGGFYFYYTFLGNDIMTHRFFDLASPNFPAERVSVRFRASLDDLRTFFREVAHIVMYLCHDSRVVGFADVPLTPLLEDTASDMAIIEKVFPLYNAREELPLSAQGIAPSIGVSMALSLGAAAQDQRRPISALSVGEVAATTAPRDQGAAATAPASVRAASPVVPAQMAAATAASAAAAASAAGAPARPASARAPPVPDDQRFADVRMGEPPTAPDPSTRPIMASVPALNASTVRSPGSPPPRSTIAPWHQFRFSIELRSLRDVQIKSANVYLKYAYTPFGTASPILTHPTTHIQRTPNEELLPHSFCAFEFVMSPERLSTYLDAVPLIVEMWHRDENTRDVLLGNASVDLAPVLAADKVHSAAGVAGSSGAGRSPAARSSEQRIVIQSVDMFVPVMSTGEAAKAYNRVADLRVVLALEDFGPVEELPDADVSPAGQPRVAPPVAPEPMQPRQHAPRQAQVPPAPTGSGITGAGVAAASDARATAAYLSGLRFQGTDAATPPQRSKPGGGGNGAAQIGGMLGVPGGSAPREGTPALSSIHESQEYRVALELELWRQEEEIKFKRYLAEREAQLTARLAQEWKQRDREREALLKRKLQDYKQLEAQMQTLSRDLEAREQVVRAGEADLARRRDELERQVQRQLDEARDATRRLQDEFRHRVEMEKSRAVEADSMRAKALRERDEMEARYRALDAEMAELRRAMAGSTESALRVELANAIEAKAGLERLVDTLKKSKKYYKAELRRLFAELAKERGRASAEAEKRLLNERKDLERMRVQIMAKEHLGLVHAEQASLESAKRDLMALGAGLPAGAAATAAGGSRSAVKDPSGAGPPAAMDPATSAEIERLTKERDRLLATGIYRRDDETMREFDARIAGLMASPVSIDRGIK